MAKVTEGSPYYYAPTPANEPDTWLVFKRLEHPHSQMLCSTTSQDNASLIVDALNHYHAITTWKDRPRPTIEELEKILQDKGHHNVDILPDGSIRVHERGTT